MKLAARLRLATRETGAIILSGLRASSTPALFSVIALLSAAAARAADALPPERPTTPYEAKIRNSYMITEPGGGRGGGDTVEIHVSGARMLEDSQIMETKSVIVDADKREVIEFDPKATGDERIAARFPLNDAPIPYIHGRAALAAYEPSWGPPTVAGKDKVAKHGCTILHYGKPDELGVAACVSKEGVVLRAKIKGPDYEREFEALEFDPGKQDDEWFAPPKEFQVVDGATDGEPAAESEGEPAE
jgi:hypothetical protein